MKNWLPAVRNLFRTQVYWTLEEAYAFHQEYISPTPQEWLKGVVQFYRENGKYPWSTCGCEVKHVTFDFTQDAAKAWYQDQNDEWKEVEVAISADNPPAEDDHKH